MKRISKTMRRRSFMLYGVAGSAALLPSFALSQQSYPSKPMKFYVPFGAGSSSDITARVYAKVIGELANQPVVVENKGGADGIIGAKTVLSEPADGYSVLFASNTLLSTNAVVRKDLPYDPLKDFDPISVLEESYAALAVPATSRFQTFTDLKNFAANNPGALTHGSGSAMYTLWNAWLTKIISANVINIPYKDSGAAARAVGGAEVDYAIVAINALSPLISSGRVRVLLYTGDKRHPQLPDVPTATELGLREYKALIWNAVAVRAGTPKPIRDRIVDLFHQAGRAELIQNRMKAQGHTPTFSGPDAMRRFQVAEIARWKKLVTDTGLKFEQ